MNVNSAKGSSTRYGDSWEILTERIAFSIAVVCLWNHTFVSYYLVLIQPNIDFELLKRHKVNWDIRHGKGHWGLLVVGIRYPV